MVSGFVFVFVVTVILTIIIALVILLFFWLKLRKIRKRIPDEEELEEAILKQGHKKNDDGIFVRRKNGNGREGNRKSESKVIDDGIQDDDARHIDSQDLVGEQNVRHRRPTKKYKFKIRKG